MDLLLLRHGIAADLAETGLTRDSLRPLTPEGIQKVEHVAVAMSAMRLDFDLILSSPFTRARQTAEIVAREFGLEKRLEFDQALGCGGDARDVVRHLVTRKPMPETVLLVGHEPDLSRFISVLVSGDTGFLVTMKKAALCKLTMRTLIHGRCASLEWLLTAKQMALMK